MEFKISNEQCDDITLVTKWWYTNSAIPIKLATWQKRGELSMAELIWVGKRWEFTNSSQWMAFKT